jgi:hypothetical protein
MANFHPFCETYFGEQILLLQIFCSKKKGQKRKKKSKKSQMFCDDTCLKI